MRVTLLGTGAADGWPNPFCRCASCCSARADGLLRGQTSALVDDVLLLDCGADMPRQAERCGRSLADVAAVLVTHAHPDHFDPAFLLYRGWVGDRPLQVLGPRAVVDACRDWLAPGSPVGLTALVPGDAVDAAGHRVRALAARHEAPGGALLYDVTAPDGDRLLYATDTGLLDAADLSAVADGPAYSTVLLEETFGDHTRHGTDHLDLTTFPRLLAGLRRAGAVDAGTDVVAVHLSHHNPPTPELQRRLGAHGARVVADGTTVGPGAPERRPPPPRRTLVTGGARSGKSREAERMLLAEPEVVYVATGIGSADDPAWQQRVAAHRARRPEGWQTVETLDLLPLLDETGPPLLVDCLTLWLAGVLDRLGAWSDDATDDDVEKAVAAEIDALTAAWRATPRRVVAVTNEVGSGVVPGTVSGGRFRDLLGRLNATVAAESEQVLLCVAGRVLPL
ncbi:MAG TPA: bifunctional adenosylcobinamide kinase/adenosylcobinamide-phosphate guanylyltransferase [Nocardioidaceae bacterium]|nr:bifunctional adenosylcobinamide kinase/adenosylcobinamide-phosphate guanylyltransferase [Nocardioidaceae bacterium]